MRLYLWLRGKACKACRGRGEVRVGTRWKGCGECLATGMRLVQNSERAIRKKGARRER